MTFVKKAVQRTGCLRPLFDHEFSQSWTEYKDKDNDKGYTKES